MARRSDACVVRGLGGRRGSGVVGPAPAATPGAELWSLLGPMARRIHPVDQNTHRCCVGRSEVGWLWGRCRIGGCRPDERARGRGAVCGRVGRFGSWRWSRGCRRGRCCGSGEQAALAGRRVAHSRRAVVVCRARADQSRGRGGESDSEIARPLGRHARRSGARSRACGGRGGIGVGGRAARGAGRSGPSRQAGGRRRCWRRSRPALSGAGRRSRSRRG